MQNSKIFIFCLSQNHSEEQQWYLVIGFLPNVTRVNGTSVNPIEREQAERTFIRHYMNEDNKPHRYVPRFLLCDGHLKKIF